MDDDRFEFLLNAVLRNADDHPYRQAAILRKAVRRGFVSLTDAEKLRCHHNILTTYDELSSEHDHYLQDNHDD